MRYVAAALLGAWLLVGSVFAQDAGPSNGSAAIAAKLEGLTAEERTSLIAKLDDVEARDLLLHFLSQSAAPPATKEPDGLMERIDQKAVLIRQNAASVFASIGSLPAALATAHAKLSAGDGVAGYLVILVALAILVAAGAAAEWVYSYLVGHLRRKLRGVASEGRNGWLRQTFGLLLLNLVGIAIFAAGYVSAFLVLWQGNEARRQLAAGVLAGILAVRATRCFAEFLFAPASVGDRIIPVTQEGARYFHDGVIRISVVGAIALVAAYLLGIWSGDVHTRLLLMMVASTVFLIYSARIVWGGRQHASHAFLSTGDGGEASGWPMRVLAYAWAPLVIAYLVLFYLAALIAALAGAPIGIARALAALIIVVVAVPVLDRFVGLALHSRRSANLLDPTAAPGHQNLVLRRAARIIILLVAILAVLGMFGVTAAARQTLGGWLVELVFNIGVVVLIAYVLRELAIAAINRRLAKEGLPEGGGSGLDLVQASRLKTILPLVRRALQFAIIVVAALMILSSLGVDIGPLLAGAGVIGLAVGFGSQTLVKDLISGLFFLLDDAFRAGEYIEVAGIGGEVERINTRSLSLRTPLGAVHTIPFGGIDAVANYSRDWAIVKMEFRVTYDTDMTKVKKIFRRIGEELAQDPELAPGFLQPFKFQGVKAMEETGILLRGKFMAIPGAQFQIRKQIYERVQKAFAEEGIKFAQRRVQVDLPPGVDLDDQAKETISNAAAAALASEPPKLSEPTKLKAFGREQ
jgi:small-conductance mechanosensitive channel